MLEITQKTKDGSEEAEISLVGFQNLKALIRYIFNYADFIQTYAIFEVNELDQSYGN